MDFYQGYRLAKFQKIKNIEVMPILQESPKYKFSSRQCHYVIDHGYRLAKSQKY